MSIGAVFLAALGPAAVELHPELRAQLSAEPTGQDGERFAGVFSLAGSRYRRLAALAVPVIGPHAIVTRFARDVPFALTLRARTSPAGGPVLETTREFRFADATQSISDRLVATSAPGVVRNTLGTRGRVELLEECTVGAGGALRMRSRAITVRIGRLRLPLRGVLRMDVDLEDRWDEVERRRTVALRASSPLLGTVLEYRGWYAPAAAGQ